MNRAIRLLLQAQRVKLFAAGSANKWRRSASTQASIKSGAIRWINGSMRHGRFGHSHLCGDNPAVEYRREGSLPPVDNSTGRERHFDLADKSKMGYGPIKLGELEIGVSNVTNYVGIETPAGRPVSWVATRLKAVTSGTSRFHLEGSAQHSSCVFAAWLMAELLQQHRGARVTTISLTCSAGFGREFPLTSAAQAFSLSTYGQQPSDCRKETLHQLAGSAEAAEAIASQSKDGSIMQPQVVIKATVEVPERAYAVHSYGPDGEPEDVDIPPAQNADEVLFLTGF